MSVGVPDDYCETLEGFVDVEYALDGKWHSRRTNLDREIGIVLPWGATSAEFKLRSKHFEQEGRALWRLGSEKVVEVKCSPRGVVVIDVKASDSPTSQVRWTLAADPRSGKKWARKKVQLSIDAVVEFERVPPGLYMVQGEGPYWKDIMCWDVLVRPYEATPVSVVTSLGAMIRGRVVDVRGAPIASVAVMVDHCENPVAWSRAAESDSSGLFEIAGLAGGRWRVSCNTKEMSAQEHIVDATHLDSLDLGDLVLALRNAGDR